MSQYSIKVGTGLRLLQKTQTDADEKGSGILTLDTSMKYVETVIRRVQGTSPVEVGLGNPDDLNCRVVLAPVLVSVALGTCIRDKHRWSWES